MDCEPKMKPACFARLHDSNHGLCQTCAVFVSCGVARMKTFLYDPANPIPTDRTPVQRPNTYPPGTCKWAAWEAISRLDGVFTEDDIVIPYYAVCRGCKIRPRRAERTIRDVVTELVRASLLQRVGLKRVRHSM